MIGKYKQLALRVICAALVTALVIMMSSCSIIKINYDKFGGGDKTREPEESETVRDARPTDRADSETAFVPPNEYEYTGKETAKNMLSTVDYDFGDKSVIIRSTDEGGLRRLTSFSEDDTDSYSIALYERFRMVEEALGCKLNGSATTLDEMKADLRAAVKSDKYYADLLLLTGEDMTVLAKEGLLLSLYSLPFFDLDLEYFHPATIELAAGNDAYGVVSGATIDPDTIPCVFYNVKKVNGSPEELVRSGDWTWNEMMSLAGGGGISFTVDGEESPDEDDGIERAGELAAAAAGLRFVSNERGKTPKVTLPDEIMSAVDVCRALFEGGGARAAAGVSGFASGEGAFCVGKLGNMESLAESDVVWGVLPIPKVTGDEESYRCLVTEPALYMTVPVNTTDAPGASALLRAFAASSYAFVRDAYEEYHMYNTVRIESAVDMIGVVIDSACFDFAHVYGSAGDIAEATYGLIAEAVGGGDAEKLFSRRSRAADNALAGLFPVK